MLETTRGTLWPPRDRQTTTAGTSRGGYRFLFGGCRPSPTLVVIAPFSYLYMNEGYILMKHISRKKQTLALLAVAQIMVILDFSIVSIALPAIQQAFHLAPADLQWVVSA